APSRVDQRGREQPWSPTRPPYDDLVLFEATDKMSVPPDSRGERFELAPLHSPLNQREGDECAAALPTARLERRLIRLHRTRGALEPFHLARYVGYDLYILPRAVNFYYRFFCIVDVLRI